MIKTRKISLKARALKYLTAREHSRLELARKLTPHAQEGDNVEEVLDWLEKSNYLSQERFSESLVHRKASRFGSARIIAELSQHGIDDGTVSHLKQQLAQSEHERALHILQRKYDQIPENAEMRAKYGRFLMQRGFSYGVANDTIKQFIQCIKDSNES